MSNHQDSHDLNRLRTAITDMDALSKRAFLEIAAAADLLLHWMESPESYQRMSVIADTLTLISYRAQETAESIEQEAASVGCGYFDPGSQRRLEAWEAYSSGGSHA
ncbi:MULTISPECIES: hypothetical protein [unclassified Serratia (in: enterobacteria)]|uniref:hypothetical protein n=1 Tax=unclassified Serratia (in: enterobacteria) TaxID=2647522 RepID=UPI00068C6D1B|nr:MULTISPECIES: hypothetical protein [unclassified Serratia (in: enterobacteria)]